MDKKPQDFDFEFLKIQLDSLYNSVRSRLAIVPQIAALSATVLVIATFNNDLLEVNSAFKVVLSILLILIPLSLFFYLIEVHFAIANGIKHIERETKASLRELLKKDKSKIQNFYNLIIEYYPYFATFILFLIICYIILELWC